MRAPAVAITGGIGCGKSEVGRILAEHGVAVLDADDVVHALLESDAAVRNAVVALCGPETRLPDGRLDRKRIAERVFRDAELRRALERVLHPPVWDRIRAWREKTVEQGPCAALIPLLFEAGLTEGWTSMWCIAASDDVAEARLMARGMSAEQIRLRRASQWPLAEKRRRASVVIENEGTRDALRIAVMNEWKTLLERSA